MRQGFLEICRRHGLVALLLFLLLGTTGVSLAAEQAEELLIGIEPEHNIFDQMERYRHLADYLSDHLGITVRLTIMSRYGEGIMRFKARKLDGAFLTPYTASMGIRELNLDPVVHPVGLNNDLTSKGYIFVRRDSGIRTAADMRGKSIVFVDPATMEGYLFPLSYLQQNGIHDINNDFSRHYFSGSHASAIFAVLDGRADIGAAKSTVFKRLADQDSSIRQELHIISSSPAVPEITLCVRNELDPQLRNRLARALLEMDKNLRGQEALAHFMALRFVKAMASEFVKVEAMLEEARPALLEAGGQE